MTLLAVMLPGMRMRIQAELRIYFAHLRQQAQLIQEVSEYAFAQAHAKLSLTDIPSFNNWLIARTETKCLIRKLHASHTNNNPTMIPIVRL